MDPGPALPRLPHRLSLAALVLALVLAGAVGLMAAQGRQALVAALTDLARAETGRDLTIAGGLGVALLPRPRLIMHQASLAVVADLGGAPLIQADRVEVAVRLRPLLRGRLEADEVRLSGVRISLVRGPDGRGNWEAPVPPAPEPAGPSPAASGPGPIPPSGPSGGPGPARDHPTKGLDLVDADLTWEDQGTGRRLALRDLRLALGPGLSGQPLSLSLAARLGQAGEGAGAGISMSALLSLGPDGAFAVTDLRMQTTDSHPTVGSDRPTELTGHLSGGRRAPIRFELSVNALDLDSFSPWLHTPAVRPPDSRAAVAPDASLNQLPAVDLGPAATPPPDGGVRGATGLPLAWELDGRLTVGHLRVAGLDFRGVEVRVLGGAGDLHLDHRVGDFYGGGLSGTLHLGMLGREPKIDLQTAVLGFQAGPLLADLSGASGLSGRGDLGVSLQTAGSDRAALLRGLQGRLAVRLEAGALAGVDLAALMEGIGSSVGGSAAWVQGASPAPRTAFDDLSASALVAGGLVHSDDLAVHGPWFRASGNGTLDLADGRLDWRLFPVLVKPPRGRVLQELEGVPIPVTLSGTLAAPVWQVDAASVLREVARRKLDGRGEDLIRGIDRRTGVKGLGEMLRGLLGR
jgi:AsmA protein